MRRLLPAVLLPVLLAPTACTDAVTPVPAPEPAGSSASASTSPSAQPRADDLLRGMPAYTSRANIYAAAGAGMVREDLKGDRELVYVPNTNSDEVHVIDPTTFKVVDQFYGGPEPQHVVPAYDMRTLYVTSSRIPGGGVVPIDPRTGESSKMIEVQDVYNLYFTPDGQYAIVVAEAYQRLDYYDPESWKRLQSHRYPTCAGINHMDFTVDGKTALVSCEFANRMIAIDVLSGKQLREFPLDKAPDGMPQDTRLLPDGSAFLVADMHAHGLYVFDGQATKQTGFIPTGRGTHGIYFSRDATVGYISNRDEGTVTILDLATLKPLRKWTIPGGGSPDMGAVSADGKTLWLTGRYHGEVYAFDTETGKLRARIPVGSGPHGLVVWPQPGRYSLGHTSNIR